MTKIVIIGDKNSELSEKLCRLLEKFGGVLFVSENSVIDYSAVKTDFILISNREPDVVNIDNSIIIFCDSYEKAELDNRFSKNNYCVYFENNKSYSYKNEITIGLSENNDISVSSIDDGSISVFISKSIETINKKVVFPCEIKVNTSEDLFLYNKAMLLLTAILVLCGKADDNTLEINL